MKIIRKIRYYNDINIEKLNELFESFKALEYQVKKEKEQTN